MNLVVKFFVNQNYYEDWRLDPDPDPYHYQQKVTVQCVYCKTFGKLFYQQKILLSYILTIEHIYHYYRLNLLNN